MCVARRVEPTFASLWCNVRKSCRSCYWNALQPKLLFTVATLEQMFMIDIPCITSCSHQLICGIPPLCGRFIPGKLRLTRPAVPWGGRGGANLCSFGRNQIRPLVSSGRVKSARNLSVFPSESHNFLLQPPSNLAGTSIETCGTSIAPS